MCFGCVSARGQGEDGGGYGCEAAHTTMLAHQGLCWWCGILSGMESGTAGTPDEQMLCDMCFGGDAVELGEVVDGLYLVKAGGQYRLLVPPGHRGDDIFTFPSRPQADPLAGVDWDDLDRRERTGTLTDEEHRLIGESNGWVEEADEGMRGLTAALSLRGAADLYAAMVKAGYDPDEDGNAEMWLYGRCGQAADAAES